jgi:hypothetical protein
MASARRATPESVAGEKPLSNDAGPGRKDSPVFCHAGIFCFISRRRQQLMRPMPDGDITHILQRIEQGDPRAAGELLPLIYDELRRLAAAKMAHEAAGADVAAHRAGP